MSLLVKVTTQISELNDLNTQIASAAQQQKLAADELILML